MRVESLMRIRRNSSTEPFCVRDLPTVAHKNGHLPHHIDSKNIKKPHLRTIGNIATGLAFGVTSVLAFAHVSADINDSAQVQVEATPNIGGDTEIDMRPFLKVRFDTHDAP